MLIKIGFKAYEEISNIIYNAVSDETFDTISDSTEDVIWNAVGGLKCHYLIKKQPKNQKILRGVL